MNFTLTEINLLKELVKEKIRTLCHEIYACGFDDLVPKLRTAEAILSELEGK